VASGILAGDAGLPAAIPVPTPLLVGAAALLAVAGRLIRRPGLVAAAVLLAGVLVGDARGAATALPAGPGAVSAFIDGAEHAISGIVTEEPRPRGERQQVVLGEVAVSVPDPRQVDGRVLVWVPRGVEIQPGDRLSFDGALAEPQDFDGFAYREYLARQGIGATSSAYRVTVSPGSRGPVADVLASARRALLGGLLSMVPEPEAALGAGILLGARSGIAPEVSDAFSIAGLTHVVAISGWNIAIVAAVAGAATRPLLQLPGGRLAAAATAGLAVGAYVLLTGASPSVVRAALMAAALVMARLGGSPAHAISALMLAVLGMLLVAPPVLWDVGFQLSALATAGLIWFGAPIERRLARLPGLVREPVSLTLAAQLTTLPVILLNFERLSLVSPLANVVVVPLVPVVMACSAAAAVVGALDGAMHLPLLGDLLAWAAGGAAWLFLRLMILAGMAAAAIPFASLSLAAPSWLAAAWYPFLLLAHRRLHGGAAAERHQLPVSAGWLRPLPATAATLAVLALLTLASRPDGRLHLVTLDIGQGDGILVRAPDGSTALIDGGPDPDLAMRRLGEFLPFWQRSIDVVVMTHPHEDHVAGLVPALERYRVALVLDPGREYDNPTYARFVRLAESEPNGRLVLARAGMVLPLGEGATLTVLYPSEADAVAALPDGDVNNASVVMLLSSGPFRALLPGDAEAPVEAALLDRGLLAPVDVLKVGHHGSDSSSTPAFLAALRPRLALISVGAGNEYGHPHAVTLEHLAAIPGLVIERTDLVGSVEVIVDGGALRTERHPRPDAGSIGAWPFPTTSARRRSCARTSCRRGSSGTRAGWRASQPRRHGWSRRPASRWTLPWSRPPPCCTTSTRWTRAGRGSTAWPLPRGWWSWAIPSWQCRSPRTR
jgi:competence protein ComEC